LFIAEEELFIKVYIVHTRWNVLDADSVQWALNWSDTNARLLVLRFFLHGYCGTCIRWRWLKEYFNIHLLTVSFYENNAVHYCNSCNFIYLIKFQGSKGNTEARLNYLRFLLRNHFPV
jgi:hypothetical protein